jgi:hypothetical protein
MYNAYFLSWNKDIKTLGFADGQVTVADLEDAIQISVHELETVTNKHGLKFKQAKIIQWLVKEEIQ